tara:strand:- start:49616 stop:50314 length:699 start_codon:yes stop_codon:yes gene_type:complete
MKSLLFFLTFLCTTHIGFSQDPDPDLFQTWYLTSLQASDAKDLYIVADISPAINPTLTIMEDLSFSGEGACNSFTGLYEVLPPDNFLDVIDFDSTQDTCEVMVHDAFENNYFGFMNELNTHPYFIEDDGDGQKLILNNFIFGRAEFSNTQLSIPEFKDNQFEIFPNPANNILFVKSKTNTLQKFELFTITGQKVDLHITSTEFIDISAVKSGIYLLKIHTDDGIFFQKILKN